MDRKLERRLIRLEGKINTIARAIGWVLPVVIGFAAYFVTKTDELAMYYGIGAAFIAATAFEWQMRRIEKWFPDEDNDDRDDDDEG
jgi:hypothetical protein